MKSVHVCFLLFFVGFTAARKDLPVLNKPWNLNIGKESNTKAILWWDFVKPDNVSLESIKFLIEIESGGKLMRKLRRRFSKEPFKTRLLNLLPGQEHTVKLSAKCDNWQESPVAEISFITPKKDWPTPEIDRVTRIPCKYHVDFKLSWKIDAVSFRLKYFKLEVCTDACSWRQVERDDRNISVAIPYETPFTFRMIAIYRMPFIGRLRRFSEQYSGVTGENILKKTLGKPRAEQDGNYIKLAWLRSFGPEGPEIYHEISVFDPKVKSASPEPASTNGISYLRDGDKRAQRVESLKGPVYREQSQTANKTWLSPYPSDFKCYRCRPDGPPLFVIMRHFRDSAHFRLLFKTCCDESLEELPDPDLELRRLSLGPEVAEAFGFSYHAFFELKIRTCLTYPTELVEECGNHSDFRILSDVGEPSRVQKMRWHFDGNYAIKVKWEKPGYPRGPIDGYKIRVQQMKNGQKTLGDDSEERLKPDVRSYIFHQSDPSITYNVSVVAFNFHMEDRTRMWEGEWNHLHVDTTETEWLPWYFLQDHGLTVLGFLFICIFIKLSPLATCISDRMAGPGTGPVLRQQIPDRNPPLGEHAQADLELVILGPYGNHRPEDESQSYISSQSQSQSQFQSQSESQSQFNVHPGWSESDKDLWRRLEKLMGRRESSESGPSFGSGPRSFRDDGDYLTR